MNRHTKRERFRGQAPAARHETTRTHGKNMMKMIQESAARERIGGAEDAWDEARIAEYEEERDEAIVVGRILEDEEKRDEALTAVRIEDNEADRDEALTPVRVAKDEEERYEASLAARVQAYDDECAEERAEANYLAAMSREPPPRRVFAPRRTAQRARRTRRVTRTAATSGDAPAPADEPPFGRQRFDATADLRARAFAPARRGVAT